MTELEIKVKLPKESISEIIDGVFEKAKSEGYFKKDELKIDEADHFISTKEASKRLDGLGIRTIIRHIQNGLFVGNQVGRRWYVSNKSINEYINNKNK